MKSWYQVKNVASAQMYHRNKKLLGQQLVYLTAEQAQLHNRTGENLVESDPPGTVLDAAFAAEFLEWSEQGSAPTEEISEGRER